VIRYHPLFDSDVREAAAWYEDRNSSLGDRFVSAVSESVHNIIRDPERFAVTRLGVRYVQTHRFPYVVLFDVVDETLIFLAVLHTARSIEKWRERLADL
jgi:plasmid stabilization system protein ParE